MPFPGAIKARKEDWSVKILVYHKPTYTDQYIHVPLHHLVHQKLGFTWTLLNRCHNLIIEEQDKEAQQPYIISTLAKCRYPMWAIAEVKGQMRMSIGKIDRKVER